MSKNGRLVDPAHLAAVRRPVEEAHNLPGVLYSEPQVFAAERSDLFASSWIQVARDEDFDRAGAFVSATVAGSPVLLVQGDDGEIRGFHNVCRHRGACVVEEASGVSRSFRCNYHAWTYGTDGSLLAAPLMDERVDFDAADYGLTPVRVDRWGGFLFVNLDSEALPLAEAMRDFPDLSRYRLDELRRAHRLEYDIAANWKIICENYSECYHCALVHPQLNRITDFRTGGRSFTGAGFNGGPMALGEGFTTVSMSGERQHPAIEGLSDEDQRQVHYLHFYPTFLIGLAPDYVVVHRVEPQAADRSRVVCDWYYPESTLALDTFDPADTIEFWDVTNRQDWNLCEMVQRGAASGNPPGPYHPLEFCVHAFDRWFVERMGERLEQLRR